MSNRLTRRSIAAALQPEFPGIELVRGNGYFYFAGEAVERWRATSVYTFHLTDLTLAQWCDEARSLSRL